MKEIVGFQFRWVYNFIVFYKVIKCYVCIFVYLIVKQNENMIKRDNFV